MRNAKCKHGHRSAMSNSAWCDLNRKCTVLKLHDMCHNPKCNCQNQIIFTPNQNMLEGGINWEWTTKNFWRNANSLQKIVKPSINATAPFIGMAVSAKTKNPKVGQAKTNSLTSISGSKNLSLTDMQGNGLRLKVMWFYFNYSWLSKWIIVLKNYMIMIQLGNVVNVVLYV